MQNVHIEDKRKNRLAIWNGTTYGRTALRFSTPPAAAISFVERRMLINYS